jgi:hypothetical protein
MVEAVNIKVGGLLRLVRAVDERLAAGSRGLRSAGHYGLEPTAYAAAAGVANAALFNVMRQLSLAYGKRGVTAHTDRARPGRHRAPAPRGARPGPAAVAAHPRRCWMPCWPSPRIGQLHHPGAGGLGGEPPARTRGRRDDRLHA